MTRKKIYFLFIIAGYILSAIYIIRGVSTSTNSTASIGYLFIPFLGTASAIFLSGILYVVFVIIDLFRGKIKFFEKNVALATLIFVVFTGGGTFFYFQNIALKEAKNLNTTVERLSDIYEYWGKRGNIDILIALAKNPNLNIDLINKLSKEKRDSVVSELALNPATPLNVLERISEEKINYSRSYGLAKNRKINSKIIDRLISIEASYFNDRLQHKLYQEFVLASLIRNPALSNQQFKKIIDIKAPEYFLAVAIIYSARTSCEQVRKYTEHENEVLKNTALRVYKDRKCS